ncbi:MAG: Lrp/AsnC family transcriptional regulator [Actinomycetota bacterium]
MTSRGPLDPIDARMLRALCREPRASVVALAQAVGISRNTVQARLAKWDRDGFLLPFDHRVDPPTLGLPMRAFVRARVKQRQLSAIATALAAIPEVVEVLGLSGGSDLLIEVVARDADDLYRIAGQILDIPGVRRTNTSLVMRALINRRLAQLVGEPTRTG